MDDDNKLSKKKQFLVIMLSNVYKNAEKVEFLFFSNIYFLNI